MAIYSLHTSPASRSNGKSAVAMAAYRSGEKLIDRITGEICDYTRKAGILFKEIFCPDGIKIDRQDLWNLAEQAEKRKDARIAREIRVALPCELDEKERINLAREFAEKLVNKYKIAIDLSLHNPDKKGDNRNYHAHLLLTTRQLTKDGLSDKSDLEKSNKSLKNLGKLSTIEQITAIRDEWENLCNLSLERHGHEQKISAKSYKDQGIDREPMIHLGPAATAMERRGIETELGTWNRIVEKNNLMQILRDEWDIVEENYRKAKDRIARVIENLTREIALSLPEPQLQPAPTLPENRGLLSSAMERKAAQEREQNIQRETKRKLSLAEEIELRQGKEQPIKRDKGGIER